MEYYRRFQTGMVGVFDHWPDGYMWTGSGPREVVIRVEFDKPFKHPPEVMVALSAVDAGNSSNLRVNAVVRGDPDIHHFDVAVSTWADTKLATVSISWMAFDITGGF